MDLPIKETLRQATRFLEEQGYRYIEDWLEQFAEALERPKLIERYHSIQEQVATILRKPKAASPPES